MKTTINTANKERLTTITQVGVTNTAVTKYKNGILYSSSTASVQTPVIYYYDAYGRSTAMKPDRWTG